MHDLTGIPCIFMRGGTSRGPYFRAEDLPADTATRDRVLLAAMGSPDMRQIDGLGGADTLTSKVAIVSKSTRPGVDVDYLFARSTSASRSSTPARPAATCWPASRRSRSRPGWSRRGRRDARDDLQRQHRGAHRGGHADAGRPRRYTGDARIDGVPGTAAPIVLNFMDMVGSARERCCPPETSGTRSRASTSRASTSRCR